MNGFPTWTLWGMGLSALVALIAVILAFIGLSPRLMRRLGLDVYRLDLRVRSFIGYAFAGLLLAIGFFLAGVPLGSTPTAVAQATLAPAAGVELEDESAIAATASMTDTVAIATATVTLTPASSRPASGAFGGVPNRATATVTATQPVATGGPTVAATTVITPDLPSPTPDGAEGTPVPTATGTPTRVTTATPTATVTPSATATPSSTPTPTPTPTASPTPTLTPTPIEGETATIDSDGANIWLHRSPGGQTLVLISDEATVILMSGRANHGGALWREIMTVDGLRGWIEEQYVGASSPATS